MTKIYQLNLNPQEAIVNSMMIKLVMLMIAGMADKEKSPALLNQLECILSFMRRNKKDILGFGKKMQTMMKLVEADDPGLFIMVEPIE